VGDPKSIIVSKHLIKPRSRKRPSTACSLPEDFECAQLTVDQFLDSKQEAKRFTDPNCVKRFKDAFGSEIGPYRLFLPDREVPGLKVARSLGDFGLEDLGVKHTPIYQMVELYPSRDRCIVLGTDGLWSVMDNSEVAGFVEKYRSSCTMVRDNESEVGNSGKVDVRSGTVCRMLCEEARKRWLDIIKNYDVQSDDISAIVLEFTQPADKAADQLNIPLLQGKAPNARNSRQIIRSDKVGQMRVSRPIQCPAGLDGRRRSVVVKKRYSQTPGSESLMSSQRSISIRRGQTTTVRQRSQVSMSSQRARSKIASRRDFPNLTISQSNISIPPTSK
jgi:serine/threonine protein phosphatase PrpC